MPRLLPQEGRSYRCPSVLLGPEVFSEFCDDVRQDCFVFLGTLVCFLRWRRGITARVAAVEIGEELKPGDQTFALRILAMALSDFRSLPECRYEDFLQAPASTGSIKWDTLLAVAVGIECEHLLIDRPAWTKRNS